MRAEAGGPRQGWLEPLARTLVASFLVLNLVLVELRPDLSIRQDGISSYLAGDFRWLGVLTFLLLSAGGALLAAAVRTSAEPSRRLLSALLLLYSFGVLLAGLTPPDSGLHYAGAFAAFTTIPVAALVSSSGHRILWFAVLVASFATWPVLHFGAGERLTTVLEVVWLLSLRPLPAGRDRTAPPGPHTRGPGAGQA